jgi:hypothetical protein
MTKQALNDFQDHNHYSETRDSSPGAVIIDGCTVTFKRRRYGSQTYTWVFCNGESLGDPWPCINPPRSEIKQAIQGLHGGADAVPNTYEDTYPGQRL